MRLVLLVNSTTMKRILLTALVWCAVLGAALAQEDFRKQAPMPGPAPRIEMGAYQAFKLKNGLRVIVVENHKIPKVSFQLLVDVPVMHERQLAGVGEMAGQMLVRGTRNRTKSQIDEEVDFIGATLSSSGSGIFASSLTKHRDKLLEIMSEVLLAPTFPQDEFDKLKKQTISGIVSSKDDPNTIATNVGKVLAYGKNHPYGELTSEATVEAIRVQDCKTYYETYFRPEISYLAMVGDITPKQARKLAQRYFGAWKQGAVLMESFDTPQAPAERKVAFVNKPGAVQSVINITYPVELKPGAPDAIKASVMNTLLGGYFSSRFNANIREDKGYSYGVRSVLSPDKEVAVFTAGGAVRNQVTDSTVTEFLYEMQRLRNEAVPEAELSMVKNVMNGNFARSLEDPENIARYALNIARYNLPKDYYATYLENLSKVTPKDIMDMAHKYLLPDRAWVVVVGNKDIADRLEKFAANGKVMFYNYYGEPIDDGHTLMPDGVSAESIIEDYLEAIGGRKKLNDIKDMSVTMKAEVQGMTIQAVNRKKVPNKMLTTITMSGMMLNQVKCDGEKVEMSAMGQAQPIDEQTAAATKRQARMFPEMFYAEDGLSLAFKGIENVNGKNAYRVDIVDNGKVTTEYFDMTTGLKIRSINVEGENSIITDYEDYRELNNGIRIPYKTTVSGAMPFPLVMQVEKATVNEGLEDKIFMVK